MVDDDEEVENTQSEIENMGTEGREIFSANDEAVDQDPGNNE